MVAEAQQRGTSLMEVLVALLILSVAVVAVLGLQARAHSISQNAEEASRASLLASDFASNLLATQTAAGTISPPDMAYWSSRAASAMPRGSLSYTPAADSKSAGLSVYWKQPSAASAAASNVFSTRVVLVGQ